MRIETTGRGFIVIYEKNYLNEKDERLVGESSSIGDYEDSWENPGSSYLWIGQYHHLNREQITELIQHLQYWLDNKRLPIREVKNGANEKC